MALNVSDLKMITEQAQGLPPGQKLELMGGDRETLQAFVKKAEAVKGVSPEMDKEFVKSFNALSKALDAGMELKISEDGRYQIKEDKSKKPKKSAANENFNKSANNGGAAEKGPQFYINYNPDGPVVGEKPQYEFTFQPARPPGM